MNPVQHIYHNEGLIFDLKWKCFMRKTSIILTTLIIIFLSACKTVPEYPDLFGNWKTSQKWEYQTSTWTDFSGGTYIFSAPDRFELLSSDGNNITSIVSGGQNGEMQFQIKENKSGEKIIISNSGNEKTFLEASILKLTQDSLVLETIEEENSIIERILFLRKEN